MARAAISSVMLLKIAASSSTILLLFGLLSCGCQLQPTEVHLGNTDASVRISLDQSGRTEDAPPDGSRILLVDGADCVVRLQMDESWTVTFAGGEPAVLVSSARILARPIDIASAMVLAVHFGGVGLSIPTCAAKEISRGGCGAPAAKRAAARMLAGTYRLIGTDWQGKRSRMTLDLTDAGRKLLRDALEGRAPPTSWPTTGPIEMLAN